MSHLSKLLALLKYLSQILNPTIFKRVLQPIYKSWKTTLKVLEENLDDNGALKPIIELMSSNQLQAMLLAWIPVRYGSKINTGVFAVDMFVTTAIATCLVSGGTFVGKLVKTLLLQNDLSSDDELTIRVDHHRITTWGDKTINPHYNSLLWLISRLSSSQAKGHYRMIVSNDAISKEYMKELIEKAPIRENDSLLTSICAKFNPLENLDDVSHLDFNLIPRDDAKLTIDHEGEQYLVWFDRETEETEKKTDGQTLHSEPSLVIQKAEGSQKKTTIKDMYEWVVRISRLYDRYMDNFDERFRYEYDSENGWDVSNTLHVSRGLSAVSLDKPQEKILKKDLETFMKDREFYVRMGMPYRRGYLFSGKPGTGKTSLIHAISAAYKRNLYYINLKEIKNDANLQSAFSNIAKNSIAVLEDVDAQSSVVHNRKDTLIDGKLIRKVLQASTENLEENPSTDTKDEQQSEVDESEIGPVRLNGFKFGGPSLSTLLNCLDGYTLNDGIIIIMTSNHPELLDPALIRPGRIDLHLELGYCTHYQIQHMFDNVMNMKSDPDQKLKPTDEIEVKKGMMNTKVVDNPGIQVQKSEISLDLSGIPEGVIPPCDAMRILLLYRTDSPEIITQKLKERAEELLSGKAVGEPMNLDNEQ